MCNFIIAQKFRKDLHVIGKDNQNFTLFAQELTKLFEHLTLNSEGNPSISPMITLLLILVIVLSLSGELKLHGQLLALWIIATLIIATFSQGYAFYNFDFRLHRSLVIYPIFLSY